MTNTIDTLSNKPYAFLYDITWHTTTVHYAGFSSDIVIDSITYVAVPELSCSLPTLHGGIEKASATLTAPVNKAPFSSLIQPYPSAPVTISIWECNPEDPTSKRGVFFGEVTKISPTVEKDVQLTSIEITDLKGRFDFSAGIIASTSCQLNFGDAICGISLAGVSTSEAILSKSGNVLTFDVSPSDSKYYQRGKVVKDGISIMIEEAEDGVLRLIRIPPPSWVVGTVVTLVAGCDKTIASCRDKWDNESQFMGCGYAMPNYNPLYSEGN